jgi:hypothetical protein
MTTSISPTRDFAELDRLILDALGELRAARTAATRPASRAAVDVRSTRAEEHLNALLDYRSAAQRG